MVDFRIGFTISGEALFAALAKFLPLSDVEVQELPTRPAPAAPKPAQLSSTRKPVQRKQRSNTGTNALLEILADGQPHRTSELRDKFKSLGYAPNGVSSCIERLRKRGKIHRIGDGVWQAANSGE